MAITAAIIKYRQERRRQGSMPAHPALMETGLATGFGFQRELEASLSRRLGV